MSYSTRFMFESKKGNVFIVFTSLIALASTGCKTYYENTEREKDRERERECSLLLVGAVSLQPFSPFLSKMQLVSTGHSLWISSLLLASVRLWGMFQIALLTYSKRG